MLCEKFISEMEVALVFSKHDAIELNVPFLQGLYRNSAWCGEWPTAAVPDEKEPVCDAAKPMFGVNLMSRVCILVSIE